MPFVSKPLVEKSASPLRRVIFGRLLAIALLPALVLGGYAVFNPSALTNKPAGFLALAMATISLCGALIWLTLRRLEKRLNLLIQTEERFLRGERFQRLVLPGDDEIRHLADLFNRLADEWEKTHVWSVSEPKTAESSLLSAVVQAAYREKNLTEALQQSLQLLLKHFDGVFGIIYSVKENTATSSPVLTLEPISSWKSEGFYHELPIATDQTLTLDMRAHSQQPLGSSLATRSLQIAPFQTTPSLNEIILPLSTPLGQEAPPVGVLRLVLPTRSKGDADEPLSSIERNELAIVGHTLALLLYLHQARERENIPSSPAGTGPLLSLSLKEGVQRVNLDEETLFRAYHRMNVASSERELLDVLSATLQQTPFISVVFARPLESETQANLNLAITHLPHLPSQALLGLIQNLPGLPLEPLEEHFAVYGDHPFTLSDFDSESSTADSDPTEIVTAMRALARLLGCHQAAYIPVLNEGKLSMLLLVGTPPEIAKETLREEVLQVFTHLIQLAAAVLRRIQSEVTLQRQGLELEILRRFSARISQETEIPALMRAMHQEVESILGSLGSFAVGLYEGETNTIRVPYMVEEGQELVIPPFPLGEGLSSVVIRSGKPLLLSTAQEVLEFGQTHGAKQIGEPAKCWLGVPMTYGGETLGLIIVQDIRQERRFTRDDERLLSALAAQAAIAVRNIRLLERTRRQAQQERLTTEISDRLRRAVDMPSILKITAEELAQALGARKATVRIAIPSASQITSTTEEVPSAATQQGFDS